MGQEICGASFRREDFAQFHRHLAQETALLEEWFATNRFDDAPPVAGCELEAWLVDAALRPAPVNDRFIQGMDSPLVSPELARFNVEFNTAPYSLTGDALSRLHTELQHTWELGRRQAQRLDAELVMIGILPTVGNADLCMANLSDMNRYRALNNEVMRLRQGRPLTLDIHGVEVLRGEHHDVMLESATTSFQVHLQVPPQLATRAYNASIIASAPLVAVSANSPYLFGHDLWAETRIPLFEQSVQVGGYDEGAHGPMRRVTFGSGYARHSVFECFKENLEHFPVLLPIHFDEGPEQLPHLRLHNGTLWRWNRPLIGFDNHGKPHLRIEHRVAPAGPTVVDMVANAAFYYGLAYALCAMAEAPENGLPFAQARDNFYACAQLGLDAHLVWLDGQKRPLPSLLTRTLLPLAAQGLEALGITAADSERYLGIIQQRVLNGCNGAAWQRAFVARHGVDMTALLAAYLERQQSGAPVHEWDID